MRLVISIAFLCIILLHFVFGSPSKADDALDTIANKDWICSFDGDPKGNLKINFDFDLNIITYTVLGQISTNSSIKSVRTSKNKVAIVTDKKPDVITIIDNRHITIGDDPISLKCVSN